MNKNTLIGVSTLLAVGLTNSAMAQDAAAERASRTKNDERRSINTSGSLEEVIVSAQRRQERLQDVPIAISVMEGSQLDRTSSRGVIDILNQVGGVSMVEFNPGNTQIAIRGVLSSAGTSPTAFYLDEVPFTFIRSSSLPDANAFDLARVEVLNGPQGTLYGAAALGGVVRVITADADLDTFEIKGRARVSSTERGGGGNYGSDAALNVPLIPGKFAVRAVAGYSDMSGFISSTVDDKKRINDSTARAYRLKLNYQVTNNLSAKFGYSRSSLHSGALSMALDDFTTPFSSERPSEFIYDTYNLITEYRWETVSLLSSTGYIDMKVDQQTEQVIGGRRIPITTNNPLRSFSQEIRLSSHLHGPWQWSAGGIYKDTTEKYNQAAYSLFPLQYQLDEVSESYAVFAEVRRSLGSAFEITTGVRYFDDRLTTTQYQNFTPGPVAPEQEVNSDKWTGRIVFTYKPQDDSMLYASVSTGFRSGLSQTPAVAAANPGFPGLKPDSLTTYEIGAKGQLSDSALTYNAAVYYTDWKDIQQSLIVPAGFLARVNAGRASGMGADLSLSFAPLRSLALHASVGWNDLTFEEDILQGGMVLFAAGGRLNDSPEWTGSVGADYRVPTRIAGGDFVLSSDYSYGSTRTVRYLTGSNLDQTQSDIIGLLGASVGYEGERWSVSLYGDNLLNEDGRVTGPANNLAFTSVRSRPRTYGVQLTMNY